MARIAAEVVWSSTWWFWVCQSRDIDWKAVQLPGASVSSAIRRSLRRSSSSMHVDAALIGRFQIGEKRKEKHACSLRGVILVGGTQPKPVAESGALGLRCKGGESWMSRLSLRLSLVTCNIQIQDLNSKSRDKRCLM